ncbi:MAG: acyl-CoA desaturase [Saprospiraceae bacterium]
MAKVSFNNQQSVFFNTINTRVEQYFESTKLKRTGNRKLYIKTFILIGSAVAIYSSLLLVSMPPALAIFLCCLFGIVQAGIGFNVMHDANHGSYSSRRWVNDIMSHTANMLGVNSLFWKQKHNVIHHTYTNVDGVDDDIIKNPMFRMCPTQKHMWIHKFQYLYCVPLYGLTSIVWVFVSDFAKYFQGKIQTTKMPPMVPKEHAIFWLTKVLYIFFYVVLPIYIVGFVPFIIGFAIAHFTLGIALSLVFQLAHVVESTHFEDAKIDTPLHIQDEWAIHQVRSTADFATKNKIISWFTGGLNFQIEHHLYPRVSHVHYPVIHNIVKEVCEDHSVRFNNYPSMGSALMSHFRFLKQLGSAN